MDGLLVVDKPVGPTSHDVVARVRQAVGERRIGHAGTLDPGASGVLVLVMGRATRLVQFLTGDTKTYEAVVRLGVSTDTYDWQGQATGPSHAGELPPRASVEETLSAFVGTILQCPPPFSAKKIGGHRSYDLARLHRQRGNDLVVPPAVSVSVERVDVTSYGDGLVGVAIDCSAGFYVRSLAHDLGERLGTGAHLASLRRTRSGEFTIADAHALTAIEGTDRQAPTALVPMSRMLTSLPAVTLTIQGMARITHGRDLGSDDWGPSHQGEPLFTDGGRPAQAVRVLSAAGDLLAVATMVRPDLLHPSVVLK